MRNQVRIATHPLSLQSHKKYVIEVLTYVMHRVILSVQLIRQCKNKFGHDSELDLCELDLNKHFI